MVCQWRFILVNAAGNAGICTGSGVEGIWEISVSPSQFYGEPKTSLKKLSLKKVDENELDLLSTPSPKPRPDTTHRGHPLPMPIHLEGLKWNSSCGTRETLGFLPSDSSVPLSLNSWRQTPEHDLFPQHTLPND